LLDYFELRGLLYHLREDGKQDVYNPVYLKDVLAVQKEKGIWENNKDGLKMEAVDSSIVSEIKDTESGASTSPISTADLSTYFSGQGI